jgi:2-dehydro-3-deoxyphosphogluconate aldolase/(4S)-4-hydroxy-2-oxoglutarate aldolase
MESNGFFAAHLSISPVMGIFRGLGTARTLQLCQAAWDAGVQLIEIPVQSKEGLDCLHEVASVAGTIGRLVGAGTVTTLERLQAAAEAGASFTVAPGLNRQVAEESARLGLPHLPGVATATEISSALSLGLVWQKMFPAAQLGSAWVSAQHGPFPEVQFIATGGIDAYNATDFLVSGAAAVAAGSAFADGAQIARLSALKAGTTRDYRRNHGVDVCHDR